MQKRNMKIAQFHKQMHEYKQNHTNDYRMIK